MRQTGILVSTSEAAATLTAGVDAFRNDRKRTSSRLRFGTGISVVGSAAINDTVVDIYIENYLIGRFRNTRAGVVAAIIPDDVIPVSPAAIPIGSGLSAIIITAPTTNPLLIAVYGYDG